jgi:hypothetical protein
MFGIPLFTIQLENGHPATLRNLDGPDQYDIARSDVVVPDKIFLIAFIGLVLRFLKNEPAISFQENVWKAERKLPP